MERPSDGNAALPAASGEAVPRWKALLATGIRRLAVWGTGLPAALVALLALAQMPGPVSAGSGAPGPVFPDGFLSRGRPPVLAHAAGDARGGTRQRFLNLGGGRCGLGGRPLRRGKEPAGGCGQKKTPRRRVVFFRIRERGRAYSLGWSSSGRLAVSCWPCSRLR